MQLNKYVGITKVGIHAALKKLVGNFTAYTESGTNVDTTKLVPSSLK